VAGSLGEAQLQLGIDLGALQAGLDRARQMVAQTAQAFQGAGGKGGGPDTLFGLNFKRGLLDNMLAQAKLGSKEFRSLQKEIQKVDQLLGKAQGPKAFGASLAGLATTLAGAAGIGVLVRQIADVGQASERSKIQLNALADAYGESEAAMASASRIAKILGLSNLEARSSFAQLYGSLRGTGIGLKELEVLYVGLNKAARLSGAGSAEAASGILQLKQAFAAGRAQGDELRSVLENLPVFAQAVAKEMNTNVGSLRELGAEGKITSDILFKAAKSLATASAPAKTQLESLGATFTNVKEAAAEAFGPALNSALDSIAVGVRVLGQYLADNKESIVNFAKGVIQTGKALAPFAIGIGVVVAAFKAWRLAANAAAVAQAALLALTGPKGWAILAGAVVATGAAMYGLNKISSDAEEAIGKAGKEAKKAADDFNALIGATDVKASGQVDKQIAKKAQAARDEYRMATKLAGLEGTARQAAEAQLQIDAARLRYKEAIAAASGKPGDANLKASAEAASDQLESAMAKAGDAMKSAAKSAADQLKSASDSLKGVLRSNLDLLNEGLRKKVIADARASLNKSLATGRFDETSVRAGIKTNQDLIDTASKLEGINASFDAYKQAQDQVARTQEQLGVSFTDLGVKLDQTASEMAALAKKDWNVYVNGQQVSGYGEMVNAISRGL